jgi:hypothetical protein
VAPARPTAAFATSVVGGTPVVPVLFTTPLAPFPDGLAPWPPPPPEGDAVESFVPGRMVVVAMALPFEFAALAPEFEAPFADWVSVCCVAHDVDVVAVVRAVLFFEHAAPARARRTTTVSAQSRRRMSVVDAIADAYPG